MCVCVHMFLHLLTRHVTYIKLVETKTFVCVCVCVCVFTFVDEAFNIEKFCENKTFVCVSMYSLLLSNGHLTFTNFCEKKKKLCA